MRGVTVKDRVAPFCGILLGFASGGRPWPVRRRLCLWALTLAVVAPLLTLLAVLGLRGETLDVAEANIGRLNFVLAESLDRLFSGIDFLLAETAVDVVAGEVVGDTLRPDADGALHARLRERIAHLPVVARLAVADAAGRVIGTSSEAVLTASASIADRAYFIDQRDRSGLGLVVSEPVESRATGQWTVVLSRRVTTEDGRFRGVVLATLDLEVLDALFAQAVPEAGARVTLLRRDLVLLFRHPYVPGLYGRSMALSPTYQGLFGAGRTMGSGRYPGRLDHRYQIAAGRALKSYPFILSITVPEDTVLERWVGWSLGIGGAMVVVVVGLGGLMVMVCQQSQRREASEHARVAVEAALAEQRRRLRTVIDASHDGFWEWHLDTGLVDWSERCCVLMGLPAAGAVLHVDQVVAMIDVTDRARYWEVVRRHIETDEPFEIEARWHALGGGVRCIATRGRVVRGADGQPRYVIGGNCAVTGGGASGDGTAARSLA